MNIAHLYKLYAQNYLIDTDSRKVRKESVFFGLKGENFNGNKFAAQALESGSRYAVIDEEKYNTHTNTILVDDVLLTLQELANFHRRQLNIPIIALTGSNGKTTSKELINAVLSRKFDTASTAGNLNNHIGVPLTLLAMTPKTEIGIVEMGANHLKEIEFLCRIAEPNYGYITNFGKAHLEGFGSYKGVIEGKSELYKYLRSSNGTVFMNNDDAMQVKQSFGITNISFNKNFIPFIAADPFVIIQFKNTRIESQLIGKYNYNNLAAAIAIGNYFKISEKDIKYALEAYIPSNNRSQLINKDHVKIILDAYNANPSSMKAALENFNDLNAENKIIFLGDMFELGEESATEHQNIAQMATSYNFSKVYLIGKAFSTVKVKNAFVYDSFDNFKNSTHIKKINKATILIKGSRGMALERILDLL
jgi:UDP-N-acetylmuramoyl-tripeptide--D-alanyl-D-alanine ligase